MVSVQAGQKCFLGNGQGVFRIMVFTMAETFPVLLFNGLHNQLFLKSRSTRLIQDQDGGVLPAPLAMSTI